MQENLQEVPVIRGDEEVRLTKYVTNSTASKTVTLRREVVDIEHDNARRATPDG